MYHLGHFGSKFCGKTEESSGWNKSRIDCPECKKAVDAALAVFSSRQVGSFYPTFVALAHFAGKKDDEFDDPISTELLRRAYRSILKVLKAREE